MSHLLGGSAYCLMSISIGSLFFGMGWYFKAIQMQFKYDLFEANDAIDQIDENIRMKKILCGAMNLRIEMRE